MSSPRPSDDLNSAQLNSVQRPLLTISTFARAAGLSASALRFYDREQILVPAEVDATTGYRYYTVDQQRRAILLRRLRDADVPLALARELLDAEPEAADALLREEAARVRAQGARVQQILAELRAGWARQSARIAGAAPFEVSVDGPELGSALRQAAEAAPRRPDPSDLSCVLLEASGSALAAAATDRYWMLRRFLTARTEAGPTPPEAVRGTVALADVDAYADWAQTQPGIVIRLSAADGALVGATGATLPLDTPAERFPALAQVYADVPPSVSRLMIDRSALATLGVEGGTACTRLTGGTEASAECGDRTVRGCGCGIALTLPFTTALLERVVAALVGQVVVVEMAAADRPVLFRTAEQPGVTALLMPRAEP